MLKLVYGKEAATATFCKYSRMALSRCGVSISFARSQTNTQNSAACATSPNTHIVRGLALFCSSKTATGVGSRVCHQKIQTRFAAIHLLRLVVVGLACEHAASRAENMESSGLGPDASFKT